MQNWIQIHKREPKIDIIGDKVIVYNLRDYRHVARDCAIEKYSKRTYSLKKLNGVWFACQPLQPFRRFSHNFFCFDFGNDYLVVSVEARRKSGQKGLLFWGLFPLFRVIYTCTTEKDQFLLRCRIYNKRVYLYRLRVSALESRRLLSEMAKRLDVVNHRKLKFNLVYRNCTTELLGCLEAAVPDRFGSLIKFYYSAWLDYYLQERGILETNAAKQELRKLHDVTEQVKRYKRGNFSRWIRLGLPKKPKQ